MKIKKPKKPKNLTFQVFLGFLKKPKKPRFFKMGLDSPGKIETFRLQTNTLYVIRTKRSTYSNCSLSSDSSRTFNTLIVY